MILYVTNIPLIKFNKSTLQMWRRIQGEITPVFVIIVIVFLQSELYVNKADLIDITLCYDSFEII